MHLVIKYAVAAILMASAQTQAGVIPHVKPTPHAANEAATEAVIDTGIHTVDMRYDHRIVSLDNDNDNHTLPTAFLNGDLSGPIAGSSESDGASARLAAARADASEGIDAASDDVLSPAGVPDPVSLTLLGGSLLGIDIARRRIRR